MRPGDLVAIVRTGAGMGALQQFTTDKRLLYAALDRVKYGESRVGMSSFAPLGAACGARGAARQSGPFPRRDSGGGNPGRHALRGERHARLSGPQVRDPVYREYSPDLPRQPPIEMVAHAVQQLSDAASRASVVIHAIDPRGMPDYESDAPPTIPSHMSRRRVSRVPQQREQEVVHTEEGMFALSEDTGGLFLHDTNDLAGALRKAAEDSDGYYLIGYHPDASDVRKRERPGQVPQHRREGETAGPARPLARRLLRRAGRRESAGRAHARRRSSIHALQSPFSAGSIHPRLTAVFSNLPQAGSFINALRLLRPRAS